MCHHKNQRYLQSSGLSFICKYISLISQTTATAFLLNSRETSNRSFWSFGHACIKSFTDIPSFCAEASNTILVLVVFICSYNWEMCKEIAFFCSVCLSNVSLCQILNNGFLISFTHFWFLEELIFYMVQSFVTSL